MANKANKIIYGGQVLIDLTKDTVKAENLLKGYTAHDKSGEIITGTCEFDSKTSDASVDESEILSGKTAYANGQKVTGTMPNRGAIDESISTKSQEITIQSGYHDGSGVVKIDETEQAKIIAGNIKAGVEILGVTGTHSGSEEISVQSDKKATPYTDKVQIILPDSGYDYLSQVEVAQIKYVETPNEQGGITVEIGEKSPL